MIKNMNIAAIIDVQFYKTQSAANICNSFAFESIRLPVLKAEIARTKIVAIA